MLKREEIIKKIKKNYPFLSVYDKVIIRDNIVNWYSLGGAGVLIKNQFMVKNNRIIHLNTFEKSTVRGVSNNWRKH